MVFSIKLLPSRSTLLHMRFAFAFFLLPVYVFALSQVAQPDWGHTLISFIVWHLCIYPASNGYNSYFDKDEGSIALIEKPPLVDKTLYYYSLLLEAIGIGLSFWVGAEFAVATIIYGILSKAYSHPSIRLKKFPAGSFLIVFIFQGGFIYWSTFAAISNSSIFDNWNEAFLLAGLACSCLIGASYPLTQVYQHEEDKKRGDKTLSMVLGIRGSFIFSAMLFLMAGVLMLRFFDIQNLMSGFLLFVLFILPVIVVFLKWFLKVLKNRSEANFRNMSIMTIWSGSSMLLYFILIWLLSFA